MPLLITDSGLGGLSLLGRLTVELESIRIGKPEMGMNIIYVNAVPRDKYGYNDMDSREERIKVFNGLLEQVEQRFDPKQIYVACGSLSALLNQIPFVMKHPEKVEGIDKIGHKLLNEAMQRNPSAPVYVFATPTTVSEGLYNISRIFKRNKPSVYIEQPCPGLASMISSDLEKKVVQDEVFECCKQALACSESALHQNPNEGPIVFLGCTHFSFRSDCFKEAFAELGFPEISLLDPVPEAANKLIQEHRLQKQEGGIQIQFISPYRLPELEQKTISALLNQISPQTAQAFLNGSVLPGLVL